MKKIVSLLFPLVLLVSCSKRPYAAYKTTYKTERAEQFDDKSVVAADAIKKNIKNMTIQEARAARVYFEKSDDIELIEKTLAHIMKISPNYQERADCLYELATIQLALGRLEKAREMFEQLLGEYPGVEFKKEALYRQILAHYWDCSDPERDQDMTERTLKLVQEFLSRFPAEAGYRESLETIKDYCYKNLFQAELLRMNFYIQKYQINHDEAALLAAQMRLVYVIEKLLEHQNSISSATKDALAELDVQLKALDTEDIAARVDLIHKAGTLLNTHYEN